MNTPANFLEQGRDWLDGHGKKAWIATMILGFIFFWPVGLVTLFYMIGTNRMGKCKNSRTWGRKHGFGTSTGNVAFDNYRSETLKRLEDEQSAFQSFLGNLRAAKDRAEFDQFMNDQTAPDDKPAASPYTSTYSPA